MAALDMTLIARSSEAALMHLVKRKKNWAHRNPGVMLVFAILFVIAVLLIGLFISKKISARRAARPAKA